MTEATSGSPDSGEDTVSKLTTLINGFFTHINANMEQFAKVGDLLKMMELRNKLLPDNSNQKEFWKMMEQIRKTKLPLEKKPPQENRVPPKRSRVA